MSFLLTSKSPKLWKRSDQAPYLINPNRLKSVFPEITHCTQPPKLGLGDCHLPLSIIVLGKGKRQSIQSKFGITLEYPTHPNPNPNPNPNPT